MGGHRLVSKEAPKIVGQRLGAGIAAPRVLVDRFAQNVVEIAP